MPVVRAERMAPGCVQREIIMVLLRIQLVLMCYCFNGIQANSHKNPQQQQKILSIDVNCTRDLMHLKLNMGKPFKGMVFAKGFMEECGSSAGSSSLTLPLTSCGIRSNMLSKDIMQYSVRLVAQQSSKLQLKSDIELTAKCEIPSTMMDVALDGSEMMKVTQTNRNGRMRYLKTAMKIRSWLEVGTDKPEYAIVGENATLSAIALVPRSIGMRIVDCIAFDGVGDSSQKLFDEFGCPIDRSLMAEFKERINNIEDGWSKPHEDDVVQKVFTTRFQAFKFPDKSTVHFNCGILLCKDDCPKECDGDQKPFKPLARLEIFNSLKVIAPQIEAIDRPQMEEKRASNEKFIGPDVLCVSQSRLAIAFCTLGIIFLLAVIVAIYCSLRYLTQRKIYQRQSLIRPPSDINSGRRSIFSLSSSSNNFSQSSLGDIDSKLFAYGRVY